MKAAAWPEQPASTAAPLQTASTIPAVPFANGCCPAHDVNPLTDNTNEDVSQHRAQGSAPQSNTGNTSTVGTVVLPRAEPGNGPLALAQYGSADTAAHLVHAARRPQQNSCFYSLLQKPTTDGPADGERPLQSDPLARQGSGATSGAAGKDHRLCQTNVPPHCPRLHAQRFNSCRT